MDKVNYMMISREDRTLAFKTLAKVTGQRQYWHYQALKIYEKCSYDKTMGIYK